ncbi:MAG: hypothetical protein M5R42_14420 [Rhodocyclaceae bacterium]|nr:hypothetical protein [Rhodocyclaceae bacterium]
MAGWQAGEWAFLPTLIAALAFVMKVSPETAAMVINALFMAGTCALLVGITRRRQPEAAWLACLVVLAMPAYNQYRMRSCANTVSGSSACWRFGWRSVERHATLAGCVVVPGAPSLAALFRLEAVAFYPALMLGRRSARRTDGSGPARTVVGCLALGGRLAGHHSLRQRIVAAPNRVVYYVEAANPLHTLQGINAAASKMSEMVFKYKYSREEAGYILFFDCSPSSR